MRLTLDSLCLAFDFDDFCFLTFDFMLDRSRGGNTEDCGVTPLAINQGKVCLYNFSNAFHYHCNV